AHTLGTLRLFYPAAALRHLRSFPTRRSSDLDLEIARAEMTAMGGAGEDGDFRMRVRAPFSGVISERGFVPGGRVEAGAPLFTVVDPSRVWLRVRLPADAASGITRDARAVFTVEGSSQPIQTTRVVTV